MKESRFSFAARLTEICADQKLKPHGRQIALARLLGITQPAVKKWFDGDSIPDTEKVIELATWSGVCFEWLITGRGPKKPEDIDPLLARYKMADAATRTLIDISLATPEEAVPEGLSPSLRALVDMARAAIANDMNKGRGHS